MLSFPSASLSFSLDSFLALLLSREQIGSFLAVSCGPDRTLKSADLLGALGEVQWLETPLMLDSTGPGNGLPWVTSGWHLLLSLAPSPYSGSRVGLPPFIQ